MTTEHHDEAHELVLAEILAGELDVAAATAAAVRECRECRAELARMQATTERLDAAGREHREMVALAAEPKEARGLDTPVAAPRRWLPFAAAAALLIVVILGVRLRWFDEAGPRGLDHSMLLHGAVDVRGFHPAGAVAEAELFPFRWEDVIELLDPTYRIEVREIDRDGNLLPKPIVEGETLRQREWLPDEQDRARILACAAIQWQVIAKGQATEIELRLPAIVAARR